METVMKMRMEMSNCFYQVVVKKKGKPQTKKKKAVKTAALFSCLWPLPSLVYLLLTAFTVLAVQRVRWHSCYKYSGSRVD